MHGRSQVRRGQVDWFDLLWCFAVLALVFEAFNIDDVEDVDKHLDGLRRELTACSGEVQFHRGEPPILLAVGMLNIVGSVVNQDGFDRALWRHEDHNGRLIPGQPENAIREIVEFRRRVGEFGLLSDNLDRQFADIGSIINAREHDIKKLL